MLDAEKDYDFVTITDGSGAQVARVTGTCTGGYTSPCITTNKVNVRFTPDEFIVAQGLEADAVTAC